ncbi:MAG: efflux RND transporter permease subunit [Candidatus Kapaibacterium sp.]
MSSNNNGISKDGSDVSQLPKNTTEHTHKEFGLTSLSVNNRIAIFVLTAIIAIMGTVSYLNLPKEAAPEVVIPMAFVSTPYFGVSPSDIESQITQPIEKELKGLSGVKKITSQSMEGYSAITIEFDPGIDLDEALQKVRDRVDLAKKDLPDDAEEPRVVEINTAEFPILFVNISGKYSLVKLKEIAEDVKDEIEMFPEVLEVDLSGGLEREVQVNVDLTKVKYYNISLQDVINAIRNENTTIPGGTVDVENMKFLARVPGEFNDPEDVLDIVVKTPHGGGAIYVRDVASVDFAFKDRATYARLDGDQVITLAVKKRVGSNILNLSDKVNEEMDRLKKSGTLPPTTEIVITNNQSDTIRDMVSNLENNIIFGLILVVGVLLFFMGVRNATLVGIAVPLSMLLSFIILSLIGTTMNMIVLFSLILALGMLVDNAIVVVENIYRYVSEDGYDKVTAAKLATGEVAMPIITSTLTTLFAFLPLAFWPGIIGDFMKYLPITLIITLGSSLFVALVINPTLSSRIMRVDGEKGEKFSTFGMIVVGFVVLAAAAIAASSNFITFGVFVVGTLLFLLFNKIFFTPVGKWIRDTGFPATQNAYRSTLIWALDHRVLVFMGMFVLLITTWVSFVAMNNGVEFFPRVDPRQVSVTVESPVGTNIEQSNQLAKQLEARRGTVTGLADAEASVTTVGSSSGNPMAGGGGGGEPNVAQINISFKKYQERSTSPFATMQELREVMGKTLEGADIRVAGQEMGPPTEKPINIEIKGEDFEEIGAEAEKILALIEKSDEVSKLDALQSNFKEGSPELVVRVDRDKAGLYGLNTMLIGSMVRSAINGTEASKYREGDDEYDIVVRLDESQRNDLDALSDMIVQKDGKQTPLVSVAHWDVADGYATINHKDLDQIVTVTADVVVGFNANEVVENLKQLIEAEYEPPPGVTVAFTGQQEQQQETGQFLMLAFAVAVLLIFGTLVAQFNSAMTPIIIMFSVLFSTIGAFIGLMLFQLPFGIVMTGVGVISLAGVAVNNAIVLIDFIEVRYKRDGMSRREAIVDAGVTRLRPVVLTTLTTIIGLVPLAIGLNVDFVGIMTKLDPNFFVGGEQSQWWFSLCITVIFGLSFATVMTLIVVPVMYSLADSLRIWLKRKMWVAAKDGKGEELRIEEKEVNEATIPASVKM